MYKIRGELCLREVELSDYILLAKQRLLEWIALSLGLIGERDSRKGIIHVLDALFYTFFVLKKEPTFQDVYAYVKRRYVEMGRLPPTEEAVRHHLRRLLGLGLIRREKGRFFLNTSPEEPGNVETVIRSLKARADEILDVVARGFSHLKALYS